MSSRETAIPPQREQFMTSTANTRASNHAPKNRAWPGMSQDCARPLPIWGYLGDRRLAYFEYTPNWEAETSQQFLAKREGPIQVDAMRGYDWVFGYPGSKAIESESEIKEVLEREQAEGGAAIMIPVMLSDLFSRGSSPPDWWPEGKEHIYMSISRRVAADFRGTMEDQDK